MLRGASSLWSLGAAFEGDVISDLLGSVGVGDPRLEFVAEACNVVFYLVEPGDFVCLKRDLNSVLARLESDDVVDSGLGP